MDANTRLEPRDDALRDDRAVPGGQHASRSAWLPVPEAGGRRRCSHRCRIGYPGCSLREDGPPGRLDEGERRDEQRDGDGGHDGRRRPAGVATAPFGVMHHGPERMPPR